MTVQTRSFFRLYWRRVIPALAGIVLLTASIPAGAETSSRTGTIFSAAYLLALCQRDASGAEKVAGGAAACQSYIAGIIDYHNLLRSLGTAPGIDFCVPGNAKLNDLQAVVWHYLEKNAQHDAFNAAPAVALALNARYPCQAAKKKARKR